MKKITVAFLAILISGCIFDNTDNKNTKVDPETIGNSNNPGIIKSVNENGFTVFESKTAISIIGELEDKFYNIEKICWEIPLGKFEYQSLRVSILTDEKSLLLIEDVEYNYSFDILKIKDNSLYSSGDEFTATLTFDN